MSAHKTTKNHLISQLFWQTEIGADEAISAYPSVQDEMTSLKQYMALYQIHIRFLATYWTPTFQFIQY